MQVNKCMGKKGLNGYAMRFFWKTNVKYAFIIIIINNSSNLS